MKRMSKRKGVALVVALYTIAILLTLGVTFIALAISNSRNSVAGKDAQQALQFANAGLEVGMYYLSQGGRKIDANGFTIVDLDPTKNERRFKPGTDDFEDLSGAKVIGTTTGFPFDVYSDVDAASTVGDTTLVDGLGGTDTVCILRTGATTGTRVPLTATANEGNREGELLVVMRFLDAGSGAPPQYLIRARARIYSAGAPQDDMRYLIASRVVEYKVRKLSASDYMLFMENARGWDAPGAPPPNATDKTHDVVGVPSAYKIDGDVRIDGDSGYDPNSATAQQAAATPTGSANRSGNLQFFDLSGNSNDKNDVAFNGTVSIARNENAYASGSSQEQIGKIYKNGQFQNWGSQWSGTRHQMGLPGTSGFLNGDSDYNGSVTSAEQGDAYKKAAADGLVVSVNSNNGQMVYVNPNSPPANGGDVEYNDPNIDTTNTGKSVSHIPGFAIVRVKLEGQKLTIDKVGKYSGKSVQGYPQTVDNINTLQNKIVYVDGGNVQVEGNVNGQLTVVSSSKPERYTVRGTSDGHTKYSGTIYTDWAKSQQNTTGKSPPYEHTYSDGTKRWEFPPPPQIDTKNGRPVYVAREGNVTITGDVKYASSTRTPCALGLIAKNYIYLNHFSNHASKELSVQGVLMSMDHSVQFDWDKNYSRNETGYTAVKDGTFNLNGSIVSKYADVEGQYTGSTDSMGYVKQNFKHDPNLKFYQPPNFPQWSRAQMLYVNYVVLQYQDKGAVSAF